MTQTAQPNRPVELAGPSRGVFDRSHLLWLGLALILAVTLRLLWVVYVNVDPNDGRLDDSVFYHNVAHSLASGAGYVDPWGLDNAIRWPPAYPAALAVLYKLFGWHLALAKGLNIAVAAVTVGLVYVIARRIFDGRVAFLGAIVLAAFPGQIYFSTLVLSETFFAMAFMLVFLLALFWTVERDGSWWQVLVLGLAVGLASQTRSEGILLVPIIVLLWLIVVRPWRRLLGYIPLLLVGTMLALTPWTVRNAIEADQFVPLRGDGVGYVRAGLNPDVFPEAYTGGGAFNPPQPALSESIGHWLSHPQELPTFTWRKLRKLYENDDEGIFWVQVNPLYLGTGEVGAWKNLANVYFFTVGAMALLAVPFALKSKRKGHVAIVIFGIGWSLAFLMLVPYSRYHFPIGPLLSILAAAFAVGLWDRTAQLRNRLASVASS
ncbi:MAG: glycosyltransferase family 39 protein [Chloroflexi bacterium]|nr:glycosyltransferase family 39 protein [Chloroflexota bacterium]